MSPSPTPAPTPGAEPTRLTGIEVLVLDGPASVWIVDAGSIAVFAVDVADGACVGPRRFLFRVGEGQAIFDVPTPAAPGLRLVAVSVGEARVRRVDLAAGWRGKGGGRGAPRALRALADDWIRRIAGLFGGTSEPDLPPYPLDGDDEQALEDLQPFAGGSGDAPPRWAQLVEGAARALAEERLEVAAGPDLLPVAGPMWLRAVGATRVRSLATTAVDDPAVASTGIGRLHALALRHLDLVSEREETEELRRADEARRHEEGMSREGFEEVASVLRRRGVALPSGSPLLRAAAAVGAVIGVTIKPPLRSEDPSQAGDELEAIARASHVRTRRVSLEGAWWRQDCGPLIAWIRGDDPKPVALLPGKGGRYDLLDPETGVRRRFRRRDTAELGPTAVVLTRPLPTGKLALKDLFRFAMRGRGGDLAFVLTMGIVVTLLGMLVPKMTGLLMDKAIPDASHALVIYIGLALAAAALGELLFSIFQGAVTLRLAMRTEATGQAALWDRLLSLKPTFFRAYSSGDLSSRVSAVQEIGRDLQGAALKSLFHGLLGLINLALLFVYSGELTKIVLVVAAVALAVAAVSGWAIRKHARLLQELAGRFYGFVVQLISGVPKLRVAGAERRAFSRWLSGYAQQAGVTQSIQRIEGWVGVLNGAVPSIGTLCIFLFGYESVLKSGSLSLGDFLAFSSAFGTFMRAAVELSNTAVGLLDTAAKGRRVQPILEAAPEFDPSKADPGRLSGRVGLDRVVFRYRPDGPKTLDGVSVRAETGEFIALVGPSGSGKSTVLRLLLGFESPESGAVLFDGQDVTGLDIAAVRRQLGVVIQSGRLTAGSILENVMGGSVVSLDDATEALRDAGFEEDLANMPMGLHTVVAEGGGNLSGGQRQRLLIARALVRRPRVILFDEATSALDNKTQAIVSASLERRRVTRIVVAHRLSTIRDATRIYVIDAGRVVQEGSFRELADAPGLFKQMMARQMA